MIRKNMDKAILLEKKNWPSQKQEEAQRRTVLRKPPAKADAYQGSSTLHKVARITRGTIKSADPVQEFRSKYGNLICCAREARNRGPLPSLRPPCCSPRTWRDNDPRYRFK